MIYKFQYVAVFHPRPLSCGIWVGDHHEVIVTRTIRTKNDGLAMMQLGQILDPYPKLQRTPDRTVRAMKLTEIDKNGNEIRVVKDWNYQRCNCGNRPYDEPTMIPKVNAQKSESLRP